MDLLFSDREDREREREREREIKDQVVVIIFRLFLNISLIFDLWSLHGPEGWIERGRETLFYLVFDHCSLQLDKTAAPSVEVTQFEVDPIDVNPPNVGEDETDLFHSVRFTSQYFLFMNPPYLIVHP